jgi:hypothetical protein
VLFVQRRRNLSGQGENESISRILSYLFRFFDPINQLFGPARFELKFKFAEAAAMLLFYRDFICQMLLRFRSSLLKSIGWCCFLTLEVVLNATCMALNQAINVRRVVLADYRVI